MVARDLDAVFLNVDEFAELHMVEGKEIPVVMDDDRLTTLKKGQILGLVEADMLLMGKVSDFPADMEPGRLLNVDGRELIVSKSSRDMGLIEAALRQNRTM
jgi:hypothetical protein